MAVKGRKRKEVAKTFAERFAKAFDDAMAEPWVQDHAPEPAGGSPDDETTQGGIWEPEA